MLSNALEKFRCLPRMAVVIFALLVVAGIWATTMQRVGAYREQLRRDAEAELYGAQKTMHAHTRRTLETAMVLMASTDHLIGDGNTPMDDIEGILRRLQSFDEEPIEIGLISNNKQVWRVGDARGHATDVSDRDYARALDYSRSGDVHVAAAGKSRISGESMLTLSMKARPNHHGIDGIIAGIPAEHFKEAYRDLLLTAPAYIGILRQDGLVLFATPDRLGVVGSTLPADYLEQLRQRKGSSGLVEYRDGRNIKNLLAGYAMLEKLPITIFVGIDLDLLDAKWRHQVAVPLLLGVIATLLSLAFLALILALLRRRDSEAAQLREALRSAEAANDAKRHFMARMSHELRTPLNAILGFSEIVSGGLLGPLSKTYQSYGQDIHRSGQHLLGLVNQVLEIARLEAKAMPLHESACKLGTSIEEAVDMMRSAATMKQLQLDIGDLPPATQLHADPLLLRQMLLNLLSNAVKYTEPGGQIMVAASTEADGLAITVSDTGRGISEADKLHIFEPFGRGNSMVARTEDGFGLGLPIVRSLMELHGGRIDLQPGPQRGTAATLLFPARRILLAA